MKAMVYHEFGSPDNLELCEIDTPAVTDHGVLVQVRAASVNWHDWHFMSGTPFVDTPRGKSSLRCEGLSGRLQGFAERWARWPLAAIDSAQSVFFAFIILGVVLELT